MFPTIMKILIAISAASILPAPYIDAFSCQIPIPNGYRVNTIPMDSWRISLYSAPDSLRELGNLGSIEITKYKDLENQISESGDYLYEYQVMDQMGDLALVEFRLRKESSREKVLQALILHDRSIMIRFQGHAEELAREAFRRCSESGGGQH